MKRLLIAWVVCGIFHFITSCMQDIPTLRSQAMNIYTQCLEKNMSLPQNNPLPDHLKREAIINAMDLVVLTGEVQTIGNVSSAFVASLRANPLPVREISSVKLSSDSTCLGLVDKQNSTVLFFAACNDRSYKEVKKPLLGKGLRFGASADNVIIFKDGTCFVYYWDDQAQAWKTWANLTSSDAHFIDDDTKIITRSGNQVAAYIFTYGNATSQYDFDNKYVLQHPEIINISQIIWNKKYSSLMIPTLSDIHIWQPKENTNKWIETQKIEQEYFSDEFIGSLLSHPQEDYILARYNPVIASNGKVDIWGHDGQQWIVVKDNLPRIKLAAFSQNGKVLALLQEDGHINMVLTLPNNEVRQLYSLKMFATAAPFRSIYFDRHELLFSYRFSQEVVACKFYDLESLDLGALEKLYALFRVKQLESRPQIEHTDLSKCLKKLFIEKYLKEESKICCIQ